MSLFYFIGKPKRGKEMEYAKLSLKQGSPKGCKLYPYADRKSSYILHIVELANLKEVKKYFPTKLYEVGKLIEIISPDDFAVRVEKDAMAVAAAFKKLKQK